MARARTKHLVVCLDNRAYPASLEKRKIYIVTPDAEAERHGLLRVLDESGENYLCPKTLFGAIALPAALRKAILAAA